MPEQLTKELSQPKNFIIYHICCNLFDLNSAQSHRLMIPSHLRYRRRTQVEATSICALTISHTTSPIDISISMESRIPSILSQPMVNCAPKIFQQILGTNPVNVMRINHMLTQSVHCKTYVRTGVH